MVIEALAAEQIERERLQSAAALVKCDFRYLLHGDERYTYIAPIYASEEVQLTTRVIEFYDKKAGAMEFVSLESEISQVGRGVLVRAARTLLHRLPAKG